MTYADGSSVPFRVTGDFSASYNRATQEWHRALRDKYEDAARRPWLPVPPDPPGPK